MKAEIGWKRINEEGEKIQVYAHHVGDRWLFYWRYRRYEQWEELKNPPLEDWLALLDAVERGANRRRYPPEEPLRFRKRVRELFPGADLDKKD